MSCSSEDFGGALLSNCNVKIVILGYLLQCSGVDVNPMILFYLCQCHIGMTQIQQFLIFI